MYIEEKICIGLIIILILIIFGTIGFCIYCNSLCYSNETEIEITVTDKYTKGEEGTYFIVDNNDNAYVIKDLLFKGKFNSTDIYNKLKVGNTYKVKTTGVRNHFLSMYQNINEILEDKGGAK